MNICSSNDIADDHVLFYIQIIAFCLIDMITGFFGAFRVICALGGFCVLRAVGHDLYLFDTDKSEHHFPELWADSHRCTNH